MRELEASDRQYLMSTIPTTESHERLFHSYQNTIAEEMITVTNRK